MIERPSIVQDEHLTFLDELRESGATNMYGAGPYLERAFRPELAGPQTHEVLVYWMESFGERLEAGEVEA